MSLDGSRKVTVCGNTVTCVPAGLLPAVWVTLVWAKLSWPRPLHGLAHTRWKSVFCSNALEVVGFQAGSGSAPDGQPGPASSCLPASAIPRVLLYLQGGGLFPSTCSRPSPGKGKEGRGTSFFRNVNRRHTQPMHLHPTGPNAAAGGWGMARLVRWPHPQLKLGALCSQEEEGGAGVRGMYQPLQP